MKEHNRRDEKYLCVIHNLLPFNHLIPEVPEVYIIVLLSHTVILNNDPDVFTR